MPEISNFLVLAEETARGTGVTAGGHIPLRGTFPLPKPDKKAQVPDEHMGPDDLLGERTSRWMGEEWKGLTLEMSAFTEAGTVKGSYGTIYKHFFGKVTSVQNASTGQYAHMIYAVEDMFATANLGAKALSCNMNTMHEATLKNYPYIGGRISKLSFKQDRVMPLVITAEAMGQKLGTIAAGLSNPVWPAENLRLDYNNMTVRIGATVTRTGSAPDYTNITSDGDTIKTESLTLELDRDMSDEFRNDGTTSPSETIIGQLKGKLTLVLDFRDPASGFSSVDEFMAWLEGAGATETNILITWDSGTAAGTGLNHQLIIDLPKCERIGGMPTPGRDKNNTMITLEYKLNYDETTTLYAAGLLLMNTATAV